MKDPSALGFRRAGKMLTGFVTGAAHGRGPRATLIQMDCENF